MEQNTVTLSLEEYNELRDFKRYIEMDYTYVIRRGIYGDEVTLHSTDDAIEEAHAQIKALEKEIEGLVNQKMTDDQIKSMNWWQFRKWKNKL